VDFDFVLGKALSKDPRKRHSSMADLDVDLETLECGCGPSAPSKTVEKDSPRTIAVLPFKNIGGDPAMSYLGVGLADAVITRLSTSPDLIVRTTSSIMPYENQSVDPRRVAQELDVSSVLDASFQRMGDRFRATARLVEAVTGRTIWAGKVDLRLEDLFEVQDQVAHGIAEALVARQDAGLSSAKKAYTPGAEFERVLRGLDGMRRATLEGVEFAIGQFEQATRAEPKYPRAWAHLAFAYHAMVDGGYSADPEWFRKSGEALARAMALDPEDGYMHFVAGAAHLVRGRKREAYRELQASLRLAPNVSLTYHYVEYLFRLCDMYEEAIGAGARAVELEPYTPWAYGALVRIESIHGRQDRAREWMELERRRIGSERVGRLDAIVLVTEGRYQEAYEGICRPGPDTGPVPPPAYGLIAQLAGKTEDAAAIFERSRGDAEIDMDGAADAAAYLGLIGQNDEAFRLLGRATELGNDMLTHYERARWYEPLRSDPRWKPFIEGVRGRVEQYKREFRWPLI
jgi:TolB-like protein